MLQVLFHAIGLCKTLAQSFDMSAGPLVEESTGSSILPEDWGRLVVIGLFLVLVLFRLLGRFQFRSGEGLRSRRICTQCAGSGTTALGSKASGSRLEESRFRWPCPACGGKGTVND